MDYEKLYKEALEKAREYWETDNDNTLDIKAKGTMEHLFPELKQSEGERIRKEILEYFQQFEDEELRGVNISDWIAWLEKLKVFAEHSDGLYYFANSEFTYVGNPTWDNVSFLEKQGEQKPFDYENATIVQKDFAPKGEPRFNIGDWIVSDKPHINNDYRLCKVVGISDGCYTIQTIDGLKGYNTFKEWETDYHLWSIEDAKDGDVLAEDSCIFIIQKLGDNNTTAKTYYTLYDDGDFDDGSILCFDIDSTNPATKEQSNLLFQKMHEAGYTFDFESKELKKIEQNPTWAVDDDEEFEIAINTLKGAGQYDSAAWLLTLKQRIGE